MKKGISLIILTTVIVVILIISTTVIITGSSASDNAKRNKFAIELSYIQESLYKYKWDNGTYPVVRAITVDLNEIEATSLDQFSSEPIISDNTIELYEIDLSLFGNIETIYGNNKESDDIYVVSKNTDKVFYLQGVAVGNEVYYTLNEELSELISYSTYLNTAINKDGIIFSKSATNWTNQNIETRVTVPLEYTSVSVTTNVNGVVSTITGTNGNYIISGIASNYSIVVKYTKDAVEYTQIETILNFDNEKPNLNVSNVVNLSNLEGTYSYITVDVKYDKLSGVKYIKYANEYIDEVDCKTYFSISGYNIQNDMITVKEGITDITVYIEDNAGNYEIAYVSI